MGNYQETSGKNISDEQKCKQYKKICSAGRKGSRGGWCDPAKGSHWPWAPQPLPPAHT